MRTSFDNLRSGHAHNIVFIGGLDHLRVRQLEHFTDTVHITTYDGPPGAVRDFNEQIVLNEHIYNLKVFRFNVPANEPLFRIRRMFIHVYVHSDLHQSEVERLFDENFSYVMENTYIEDHTDPFIEAPFDENQPGFDHVNDNINTAERTKKRSITIEIDKNLFTM